ncbi:MAG: hypothetical protein AAGF51_14570, partial [Pseudomonadota bacterium]
AKIEQATSDTGTGAKDVDGKAVTAITEDDKQAIINLNVDELDIANDFSHVRLSITVGTAASDISGLLIGLDARYGPASDNDAASVVEIV